MIVEMAYTLCFMFFAQNVRQDSQIELQGKMRFAIGTHAHQKKEVSDMPEKTCSTCQCNKVCDHNKYGFENCGNYISDDLLPRAREIFEEIEENTNSYKVPFSNGEIRELIVMAIDKEDYNKIKKKYTEDGK